MIKEEVIFEGFDEGWGCNIPVSLFTYEDGSMDLHRQTGTQFEEHVQEAEMELFQRGLKLVKDPQIPNMIGPSGMYMAVERIQERKAK